MKFAFRVTPVPVGTSLFCSCVLGDEHHLLSASDWTRFYGNTLFADEHGAILQTAPWRAVSEFIAKRFVEYPADLEVHSDKDFYLVTWTDNGEDE